MEESLMIEVSPNGRPHIDTFYSSHTDYTRIVEAKHLTGLELVQLIIERAPEIISAVAALIAALKRDKIKYVVILPGGKRLQEPSEEDVTLLLSESPDDNPNGT